MGRLLYDAERGVVETENTHTGDGLPIETPPDTLLVSRSWYENALNTIRELREELDAYRRARVRETDGE